MNIVRKIKLSKLECYQIKDSEKKLFNFIENKLLGLKYKNNIYNNTIIYYKEFNKHIFKYDINTKTLYINYFLIWIVLTYNFKLNDMEMMCLFSDISKNIYRLKTNNIIYFIDGDYEYS